MKVKSNNLFLPRAIMLVVLLVLSFSIISAQSNDAEFVVKGLTVEDVPNDNGSGLEVSWVPLEKDKRILEYRVYRGISPDSMFFAGRIEINVKTGFAGDRVRFSDKSWTRLVDLDDIVNTPARLEQEDHQSADSPLFKSMPRDVSVLKKQMSAYTLLAGIPYKNLFLDSKPYEKNNETLAKLSLRKTKVVLKKLITGKKYYYTVVAVNEARRFFPMATPAFGVPLINSPEETNFFYGADITDTDNINFEWSRPVNTNNVIGHNIYALKKSDHESFASYKNYIAKEQKQFNNEMLASTSDEKFQKEKIEEVENPLVQIYNHPITYSETPKNFATLSKNSILEKLPQDSKLEDYDFIFSLSYQGPFETFASNPAVMKNITKSELPIVPEFNVRDQENDKGDKNLISFAKPIVFLTQSTYSNSHETKVSVNYEYAVPSEYKIDNIYFDVYSNGNKIDYVNEFFKDKSIEIDLGDNSGIKELMFKITMQTSGTELPNDYEITQTLNYDEVIQAFRAGKVIVDGEPIEDYSLSVYRKNLFDSGFRNSKDLLSTQRDHSNFIDYPKNKYKIIEGIVADKGDILVSPNINIFDNESGKAFTTSIFKKHALEDSDNSQLIKDNPFLTNLYKLKSSKKIRKKLVAAKYNNSRSYSYKILKTDGKAGFVLSEVFENENGVKYFKPISNWFYKDKVPMLIATFIFGFLVFFMINKAKKGEDFYLRPISGIQEIDNAIGRATEMGKPILFVPGLSGIQDVATLAGLAILGRVAKKAAEYDTKILVPVRDYIVLPVAQETIKEAFYEAGKPDAYDSNSAFFLTTSQFAFVAGVNGVMIREETATNFYMGMFWAESLIMTETGSTTGAIQIAGTDAVTQIPFFITTCDYTLIGEELYAAAAYLANEPLMMGTLKAQDYSKVIILSFIILGTILSTSHLTFLINAFPEK